MQRIVFCMGTRVMAQQAIVQRELKRFSLQTLQGDVVTLRRTQLQNSLYLSFGSPNHYLLLLTKLLLLMPTAHICS